MPVRKVIFNDRGLGKIMQQVKRAGAIRVRVGVVGAVAQEPHGDSGLTVGEVATINEFGSDDGHVPRRAFLGGTFREESAFFNAQAKQAATEIVDGAAWGDTAETVLDRCGKRMAQKVKDRIEQITTKPNAPSTVAKKGFDHPLIETGTMAGAITHELERGSGAIIDAGAAVGDYESFEVSSEGEGA